MVDGGVLAGVSISNITMRDVKSVIFIRLGDRGRPFEEGGSKPGAGRLRNVQISNVQATGAGKTGCAVSGIPGHSIENVTFENVSIRFEGGMKEAPDSVPEHPEKYPEHSMFGVLPAYGFFCRHASNIRFRNVQTSFDEPDARPALVCDDVRDLEIAASSFDAATTALKFRKVDGALIHGCRVPQKVTTFLDASAGATAVSVIGNDLARAREAVKGKGAFLAANRTKL
jgi:hypothetical protein